MTYWALNAVFLTIVALVALVALVRRPPGLGRVLPYLVVTGILLLMTAVFDNVMIGIGLVGYDSSKISGVFVGVAPLEDFAYAVAALVLLPSVWSLLSPRRQRTPRRVAE